MTVPGPPPARLRQGACRSAPARTRLSTAGGHPGRWARSSSNPRISCQEAIVFEEASSTVGTWPKALAGESLHMQAAVMILSPCRRVVTRLAPSECAAAHRENLSILMIANRSRIGAGEIAIQQRNTALARGKSRPFSLTTTLIDILRSTSPPVDGIWGQEDATAREYIRAEACGPCRR